MKHWNPAEFTLSVRAQNLPQGRKEASGNTGSEAWEGGGLRGTPDSCGLWVLEGEASFVGQRRQGLGWVWRWHVAEDVKAWVGVQIGKCKGKDSPEVPLPFSECTWEGYIKRMAMGSLSFPWRSCLPPLCAWFFQAVLIDSF